jgi:hypothetical protein
MTSLRSFIDFVRTFEDVFCVEVLKRVIEKKLTNFCKILD